MKTFERKVFESLYGNPDFSEGIQNVLALIGKEFHVSRVYVFENSEDNRFGDNTFEWCAEGIEPQIDELQHMSYEEYGYDQLFDVTGSFICPDTSKLLELQRELMEAQNIKATLQYGLYDKGEFCGFVGFDDCHEIREDWSKNQEELDALVFLSKLLSVYLVKERNMQRAKRYYEEIKRTRDFEKLLNKLTIGIGIYEVRDGMIQSRFLNDGYYLMLGVSESDREKYHGLLNNLPIHDEDKQGVYRVMEDALKTKDKINYNFRMLNGRNEYIWLNVVGKVSIDEGDIPLLYVGFTNVNEQVQQRQQIQKKYKQQLQYIKMISSTALASSMVNLTRNVITQQSTRDGSIMEVITRQTPQEGFELMYTHIPDPEKLREYKNVFDRNTIIANMKQGISSKTVIHPQDDVEHWLESGYIAVENPDSGDIEAYCFARDISEEVLQQSITDSVLQHAYESVMLINAETGKVKNILGNEIERVKVKEQTHADIADVWKNYFEKYSADEDARLIIKNTSLKTIKEKLGQESTYVVSFSVYNEHHVIQRKRVTYFYINSYKNAILCAAQDITQDFETEMEQRKLLQKALKEARDASHAKTDFLSRMSHDIRTPLNGIIGMTELAKDNDNPQDTQACLDKIRISGNYLLSLINDILDLNKVESGKITLNPQVYTPAEFQSYLDSVVKPMCEQNGLHLKLQMDYDKNNKAPYVDKLRVNQIFFNLVSNAVKFTPEGGTISISVWLEQLSEDRIYLLGSVSDTGIGMSREFQKRMFESFAQEEQELLPQRQGSGLGLAIVKSLITLMGGTVEVKSELGKGSTFTINAEVNIVDIPKEKNTRVGQMPVDQKILEGKRVLLVEDHPLNLEIAVRLLKKKGICVTCAENGKIAVDLVQNSGYHYYNAILMDIRMPVMDGVTAARLIRNMGREDTKNIPIIAMTANAFDQDVELYLENGMNAHLAKPIDPKLLYETLAKMITT